MGRTLAIAIPYKMIFTPKLARSALFFKKKNAIYQLLPIRVVIHPKNVAFTLKVVNVYASQPYQTTPIVPQAYFSFPSQPLLS